MDFTPAARGARVDHLARADLLADGRRSGDGEVRIALAFQGVFQRGLMLGKYTTHAVAFAAANHFDSLQSNKS